MAILIVEDDKNLAHTLERILREHGYQAEVVYDGEAGLHYASNTPYETIILDVMLPKLDGFAVASTLRKRGCASPILMLTARGSVQDKITGLDSGADDYMTKPFSPAELLAHIRALGRRVGRAAFEKIEAFDLGLDLDRHELHCGNRNIHLSHKEFSLARLFMMNPGQVIPKETIIEKVWGSDSCVEDNNVEAYVSFLRKKIRYLDSNAGIETLRKTGYRLTPKAKDSAC